MISRSPRDKEEDLVTLGSEEEFQTNDLYIKAEGIIASAFYLFPLALALSPTGRGEG